MKKEILISLLMTQPAAFSALADINTGLNPDITGENGWNTQGNENTFDGSVVTAIPGAVFTKTIQLLPGKYDITINNPDNVTFSVKVGDQTYDNPTESITLQETSDVEITVKAQNTDLNGFKLSGIDVKVNFEDDATVFTNFLNKLNGEKGSIDTVTAETSSQLATEKAALETQYDEIYKILTEEIISGFTYEIYETYELYNYPGYLAENPDPADVITEKIEAYKYAVKAYNKKVSAENERQAAHIENQNNYDNLQAVIGIGTSLDDDTLWAAYNALASDVNASTSEYAKGKVDLDALQAAIGNFKTLVDTTYAKYLNSAADETVIPEETYQSLLDEANDVLAQIGTAQTTFDNAVADDAAYNAIIEASKALKEAYNAAVATITGVKGVEGYENYFADKQADWKTEITTIYNEAKAQITVTEESKIEGCRKHVGYDATPDQEKVANEAKVKIETIAEGYKLDVQNNNEAKNTADQAVKDIETRFTEELQWLGNTEAEHPDFPTEVENTRAGYVKDIEDGLAAVKALIDGEYAKLDLTADDYEADLTKLENLITSLEELKNQSTPFVELQAKLDETVAEIKANDKKLSDFDLLPKFQDAIDEIQAKLDNTMPEDGIDTTEITEAINTLSNNAQALFDGVSAASTAVTTIEGAVTELKDAITNKANVTPAREHDNDYFLTLNDKIAGTQTNTVPGWEKESKSLRDKYTEFNTMSGTELLDAVNDFNANADLEKFPGAIKADQGTLLTEMSKENLAVADGKIADINAGLDKYVTDNELSVLPGYTTDFFDAVNTESATIAAAINAAAGDKEKLATEDKNIQALLDELVKLQETADALTLNNDDFVAINNALDGASTAVQEAIDYNIETSSLGAVKFYDDKLQALNDELGNIKTELDEAYAKGAADDNVTAKKEDLEKRIDAIETEAGNIKAAIDANERAHDDQFIEGVDVLNLLNSVYASVESKDSALVAEWKERLDAIKTTLNEIDVKVLNAYENGESSAKNEELMAEYAAQEELINKILNEINGEYGNKVIEENKNLLDEWGWNTDLASLWSAYDEAVAAYVYYRDELNNKGYKEALAGVIETSKDIYDFYTPIRELESAVKGYMNECNTTSPDPVLMKKEKIAEFQQQGQDILTQMTGKVDNMESNVQAAAIIYYKDQLTAAKGRVSEAEAAMTEAGVEADIQAATVKPVNDLIAAAETAYAAESEELLSHRMDAIATILDSANSTAIDTQDAAEQQWDKTYSEQKAILDELAETLATLDFDNEKETATNELNGFINDATELNNQATAADDLLAELKADTEALAQIVADAQAVVDASQARHDANKANPNQDQFDAYDSQNNDLEARYSQLEAYVNALAANIDYSEARAKIDAFWTAVNDNKADLVANKTAIDAKYDAADEAIDIAIEREAKAEANWLNDEADIVKAAFNDAKTVIGIDTEEGRAEINAYNDQIDALLARIDAIETALLPSNGLTHDEILDLQGEMLEIENALCDLEVELKAKGDQPNPLEPVIADLQAKYDEVAAAITEGETYLEGCHDSIKAENEGKYDDLQAQLDAVKAAWEADGNSVLAQQENRKNTMDDILADVNDLTGKIKAAEEAALAQDAKQAANDQAYADLTEEYEAALAEFNSVKERLEGYTYGTYSIYEAYFIYVETLLANAKTDLDTKNEACELTADSQLLNKTEISNNLNYALTHGTDDELNGWIKAAQNAVSTAQATLPAHIVSDVRAEIQAALADLATQAAALSDVWTDEDGEQQLDVADATLDEAKGIIDAVAEQKALAEENSFVLGDVDGDGDVDAVDIQKLVNIVGNGYAYDELEAIVREAADINGDKKLDAADIVGVINLYLSDGEAAHKVRTAMFAPAVQGDNHVSMQLVSEENGVSRYAVEITNAATFVAGQMDIIVPDGMEIVEVSSADRAAQQDLMRFDNARGMRLILASMVNAEIEGNQGAVVYIDVTGRGHLDVDNVVFADARGVSYELSKDVTGINSPLLDTLRSAKEAVYNVAGQAMNSLRRGFNIVRKSDGTTSKEYRK